MNEQLMRARRIKMESNHLCDWDEHEPFGMKIEKGKYAWQVVGDETVPAQGLYHGKGCYDNALAKYEKLKKEVEQGG